LSVFIYCIPKNEYEAIASLQIQGCTSARDMIYPRGHKNVRRTEDLRDQDLKLPEVVVCYPNDLSTPRLL
jgi:hypothetical protein